MLPDKAVVWLACVFDIQADDAFQVCASKDIGLKWLVHQIDPMQWSSFYDSLSESDREGVTRDITGMTHDQILDTWVGRDDRSETHIVWGNDMYSMELKEQEILK